MRNDLRTCFRARMAGAAWSLWEKRRAEIVEMLESCSVDSMRVPLETPLRRDGDEVFLERMLVSETGAVLFDAERQSVSVEEISIRPPAHLIPEWLPRV